MGELVIRVHNLSAVAGPAQLVTGVSFELAAGEILTLVGPSGAGKTTIAAAVAGVDRPGVELSGEVRLAGSRVGFLPQHAAATLNPARRIGASLGELVELHQPSPRGSGRRKRHRRAELSRVLRMAAFDLDEAQLDRMLRRYPHQFSGGQRTRLALAQVLATNPEVLVLDEPTAGLDPVNRTELVDQLRALARAGITVVLVSHDPLLADRLGGRVLHIRGGRVVEAPRLGAATSTTRARRPRSRSGAVELRAVAVAIGPAAILHGVDLDVRAGDMLGVVGASGAGKSTIARCVAGIVVPDRGTVHVDGSILPPLWRRSRAALAQIQYLGQEAALSFDPRRSIVDQVAVTGRRLRGLGAEPARREALSLLEELEVTATQAGRRPGDLSGGQLQRAALARALMAEPRVLICDEVTTGLDQKLAARILGRIGDYRLARGATVISIGHDVAGQLDRCDRVAVVDGGRIVGFGAPGELLGSSDSGVLRKFLAAEAMPGVDRTEDS